MRIRYVVAGLAAMAALLMPAAATADPYNADVPFLLHNYETPANATWNGLGNQLLMTGGGTTTFLRQDFVKYCAAGVCEGFYHFVFQSAGAGQCMKENSDNRVVAGGCVTGDSTVNEQQEYWTDGFLSNGKIVLWTLYDSGLGGLNNEGCLGTTNECSLESYANRVDTNGTYYPLGSGPNTQWTFVNQP